MDPLGQVWPPTGCHGEHCLRSGSHLFQALHVLEVEANVEEAQVGIDELELREAGRRSPCCPIPKSPTVPHLLAATHQDDLDDEVLLIGTFQPVIFWGPRE